MLLTFLSRLMASLLTTLLFVATVGTTVNQTLLNTKYVEQTLANQKAYSRLSTAISSDIVKNANDPALPQADVQAALTTVLNSGVLQQKIDGTLTQLQTYYRGNGPVPTLDISDLVRQAQQAGLQINTDKYDKPVELTGVTKFKKVADIAKFASIGLLVVIGLLLAGVLAIAIKRRDFRPLANIVFSLGIMLSLTGGSMLLIPRIFNKLVKFDANNQFGSLAHDLALAVIHDFALRLLIPGLIALVVGIIAKVVLHRHRPAKSHEEPADDQPDEVTTAPEPLATDSDVQMIPAAQPVPSPTPPTDAAPAEPTGAPAPLRPARKPRKIQL